MSPSFVSHFQRPRKLAKRQALGIEVSFKKHRFAAGLYVAYAFSPFDNKIDNLHLARPDTPHFAPNYRLAPPLERLAWLCCHRRGEKNA